MSVTRLWRATTVLVRVGCWLAVGGLACCALGRILAFDDRRPIYLFDSNTFWLYLPAYVIAFGALWCRRWFLAAAALVLVVAHMVWVFPPFTRGRAVPAAAAHAPHMRVVTANLRFDNNHKDDLARELRRLHPDVLLLQEVTPEWWAVLERNGVVGAYRGRIAHFDEHAGGQAILARGSLVDRYAYDFDGWPMLMASVMTPRGAVRFFDVHPVAPAPREQFASNRTMRDGITKTIRDRLHDGTPAVVAGDFNATPYNRWFDQLRGLGLHSTHEDRGRPLATTWPNGLHVFPPLQVDHVLMTDTLITRSVREGDGRGSDHQPVIVELAVLG